MGNNNKNRDYSLFHYRHAIPVILKYQIISKVILTFILMLYRQGTGLLLWNLGRPAFTSGDLPYLMRSWQGWLLLLAGFLILVIYTIFDVNAMILISSKIIHNEKVRVIPILKEAVKKAQQYKSFRGVLIILYAALIVPLTGAAFGISLTESFAIPDFIMSFINDRFILKALYNGLLIILALVGFIHLFTFHFILLGNMDAKSAMKHSRQIMKKKWPDYLKRYIFFVIKAIVILIVTAAVVYILPIVLVHVLPLNEYVRRSGIVFFTLMGYVFVLLYGILFQYYMMMKCTLLYERYTGYDAANYTATDKTRYRAVILVLLLITLGILLFSIFVGDEEEFNTWFPKTSTVRVAAHRAGGDLAHENTILGLEAAILEEADFSEIDVQRTSDGHYVINHDDTFERCCGDPRSSDEMTLEEVKKLEVTYALNPFVPPTEVATIEEFLDTAKDNIQLLIELKGKTADHKMADDLYQMVKERDMVDQVMFIGLNYDILEYVEKTYPEIRTGYLCFFGFGEIQNMNVDVLLLEAETATNDNIDKVHSVNKEVGVWTVDNLSSMLLFMISDADYIITDKVEEAGDTRQLLENAPDVQRVIQRLIPR